MMSNSYNDVHIRSRLLEFLGGTTVEDATAVFVTTNGVAPFTWYAPKPVKDLWTLTEDGAEIARSLWDRQSLIAHLDMEYVNFDDCSEPFVHRPRVFELQRPVVRAIQEILLEHGISPLHLLSGRGHHLMWRICHDSPAFTQLADLGRLSDSLLAKYAQPHPPLDMNIPPSLGRAFAGMGQLLEYFSHRVLEACAGICEIPIQLTEVEVGPLKHGREIISIDLSEYGDPLYTRTTRMPFSQYLKSVRAAQRTNNGLTRLHQPLFTIPLFEMNDLEGLFVMQDGDAVIDLARHATVQIPEQSPGTCRLIASYRASRLARFHCDFYMTEHDLPKCWPSGYDRTPLETLPRCAGRILSQPIELLLKPAGIQHIVRTLLAFGWHPRHIGGLIRFKYERNFGWGPVWFVYDAATRADFYTRLFSGLIADGLDPLIDYNCRSTMEKGYCCSQFCGEILEQCRQKLVDRGQRMQNTFDPGNWDECNPQGDDKLQNII